MEGEILLLTASYHDTFTIHGNIKDIMISKQQKWYLWYFIDAYIVNRENTITRGHGFCQKIQNKRRIDSKETEALCRRGITK